jgi:hypothetical protein
MHHRLPRQRPYPCCNPRVWNWYLAKNVDPNWRRWPLPTIGAEPRVDRGSTRAGPEVHSASTRQERANVETTGDWAVPSRPPSRPACGATPSSIACDTQAFAHANACGHFPQDYGKFGRLAPSGDDLSSEETRRDTLSELQRAFRLLA